ncbi:MAG: hypothetical protein J6A79_06490 [Clostridia bacterium]|nr:hypothetical protein [Clostridia bacterium]
MGSILHVPSKLKRSDSFSRVEFINAYKENNPDQSDEAAIYALRRLLKEKRILRVSWNRYAVPQKKRIYHHEYSALSEEIAGKIQEKFVDPVFQIFELTQLNAFVNHLIAHNTVFVYVENELLDPVFDALHSTYPGQVLLKPSVDEYYRYRVDDEIVLGRLPSETPKGLEIPWHSRMEKILVDIAIDKLLSQIVPAGEYENIFTESYEHYYLDEAAMRRYAKRKGAEDKFDSFLMRHSCQAGEHSR